jgi:serine/threonine protein kinase
MQEAGDIITLAAGAWRLGAPLARSNYGVLWRAAALADGQPAALKLVNAEQMARAEPAQRRRWRDAAATEIAFLRGLQPWDRRHIVRLLDSGEHDGLPAAALELLDTDLARHLETRRARGETVAPAQALDWLAQVNAALAKVHGYGWRHLDLKPANLLLDRAGALKLADFGTNRALAERDPHVYTGTAAWQAPEQFFGDGRGGYRTDARSDYFALGLLLYHLVTGAMPRYSNDCGAAFRAHGTAGAVHLLERHRGQMPAVLAPEEAALFARHAADGSDNGAATHALALLHALLQPLPQRRPRHALEISRLIGAARAGMDAGVGPGVLFSKAATPTLRSAA